MVVSLVFPTSMINGKINRYFNEKIMDNTSGWSFYVGSNYETKGMWSPSDRDYYFGEIVPFYPVDEAQLIVMKEGFKRYSHYTKEMFVNHTANKMSVLFADEGNLIYDIKYCFNINGDSRKYQYLYSTGVLFFTILALFNLLSNFEGNPKNIMLLFFRLIVLGFSSSFLLIEVMNRYTFIIYPVLIIIASMQINNLINKYSLVHSKN